MCGPVRLGPTRATKVATRAQSDRSADHGPRVRAANYARRVNETGDVSGARLGRSSNEGGRQPLLGVLAGRAGLGETFATQALAVILRDSLMRSAFLRHLEGALGSDLSHVVRVMREVDHREFGRTDIEGQDSAGRPALIVEAKFSAALSIGQMERYLGLQSLRSGEARPGFVLLVPEARVDDAVHLLQQARIAADATRSATAVVSWADTLDVLAEAVPEDERSANSLHADIIQLRALVDARTRIVLAPLGIAAAGEDWQTRRAELVGLVDLVTQRLADALEVPRGPQIARRDLVFAPAYYLKVSGPVPGTHVTVGLHGGFAAEGLTPIWLRFNKTTGKGLAVKPIRELLGDAPDYRSTIRDNGGHVWVPVGIDKNLANEALVDDVVRQVRNILVAAGAVSQDLQT